MERIGDYYITVRRDYFQIKFTKTRLKIVSFDHCERSELRLFEFLREFHTLVG